VAEWEGIPTSLGSLGQPLAPHRRQAFDEALQLREGVGSNGLRVVVH